ncbi:Dehydrogenase/reductase SDR family member 11, partial [Stegodyphus mimosarum]
MDRWNGSIALVTGASTGIGAAICRELVKHGMKVVGCARNVQRIQAMAEEETVVQSPGSIIPIKCDLTKEDEILSMFDKIRRTLGRLDVCINNAGLSFDCTLLEGRTEDWRTMLDVNVLALCICSREAVKLMREVHLDDGQIIQISSMSGHRIPAMDISMYAGTKFMVRALTEGLRRELRAAKSHIRVASISPGLVETEFEYRCYKDNPDKATAIYTSIKCMQPEDIAQAVVYILKN